MKHDNGVNQGVCDCVCWWTSDLSLSDVIKRKFQAFDIERVKSFEVSSNFEIFIALDSLTIGCDCNLTDITSMLLLLGIA